MSSDREVLDSLTESTISFDSERLKKSLDEALSSNVPLERIIKEGLGRGMEIVGEKYERGQYFLSDLIMSGVVMNEAIEQLRPLLKSGLSYSDGNILIGTVEGDLHDIGKNLVKYMLESAGYNVVDLGTDVSPQKFVDKTREMKPRMVCLSALLSVTVPKVKETVDALSKARLRDNLRILVGGRCLTEEIGEEAGADAYGKDCMDGLRRAKELLKHP